MSKIKNDLSRDIRELPYAKLKEIISSIRDPRDQALLCTVYTCWGRIGEIVRAPSKYSRALRNTDVNFIKTHGKRYMKISLYTLKTKGKGNRDTYVNIDREPWLALPIIRWVKKLKGDVVLFESPKLKNQAISSRTAEIIFSNYFGTENIHLMRSWRSTHASQGAFTEDGKPLDMKAAQIYGGWVDTVMLSKVYNKASGKDFLKVL